MTSIYRSPATLSTKPSDNNLFTAESLTLALAGVLEKAYIQVYIHITFISAIKVATH